jgi:hypothetical protein
MGVDLDLVLQILRHETARAIHRYCVTNADVHSVICVIELFYSAGIVLQIVKTKKIKPNTMLDTLKMWGSMSNLQNK